MSNLKYYQDRYDSEKKGYDEFYNKQQQNLLDNYNTGKKALDNSLYNGTQDAYTSYMQYQKNMPSMMKANGLNGLGISQTAQNQAYNNYQNNVSTLRQQYGNNLNELNSTYQSNLLNASATYNDKISELLRYYTSKDMDEADRVRSEEYEVFAPQISEYIKNGEFDKAEQMLNQYGDLFDGRIKDSYLSQIQKGRQDATLTQQGDSIKQAVKGKDSFLYNGQQYDVSRYDSNALAHNQEFVNQVVASGYNGVNDESIPDGFVVGNFVRYNNKWYEMNSSQERIEKENFINDFDNGDDKYRSENIERYMDMNGYDRIGTIGTDYREENYVFGNSAERYKDEELNKKLADLNKGAIYGKLGTLNGQEIRTNKGTYVIQYGQIFKKR